MNSGVPATNREADIWARLIRAQRGELSAEAAKFLLSTAFEEDDQRRMLELADRAEAGTLTAEEEAEYDGYLHVGNFLAILQSKARQALSKRGPRDSHSA